MKKIILSAIAIMTIGFANAQETKFGLKGGLNIANVSGLSDSASLTSFHIGGVVEIKVSEKFSVQPELLYTAQGVKGNSNNSGSVELNYIAIPVMAKYYVAPKFALEAGPQVAFNTAAKSVFGGNSVDIKEFVNSTDFSMNVGASFDVTDNFFAGVRYTAGLTKVFKDSQDSNKNNVFQIFVGYKF